VEIPKAEDTRNSHINNRYLNNVLGINRFKQEDMEEVKEREE